MSLALPTMAGMLRAAGNLVGAIIGGALTALVLVLVGYFIFIWHVLTPPIDRSAKSDAIVVLTGGPHRIEKGLEFLSEARAPRLFISGVHRDATKVDVIMRNTSSPAIRLFALLPTTLQRIEMGQRATTTEENAAEIKDWLEKNPSIHHLLLVTADSHLPRATLILKRALPDHTVTPVPVTRHAEGVKGWPFWRDAFIEYAKLILTYLMPDLGRN